MFDPEYMRKLFDLGYQMAKAGYPWNKAPPSFVSPKSGLDVRRTQQIPYPNASSPRPVEEEVPRHAAQTRRVVYGLVLN